MSDEIASCAAGESYAFRRRQPKLLSDEIASCDFVQLH